MNTEQTSKNIFMYIWAPNTMLSFRKKLMSQFRQMEGQTEGRTDPIWEDPSGRDRGFNKKVVLFNSFFYIRGHLTSEYIEN